MLMSEDDVGQAEAVSLAEAIAVPQERLAGLLTDHRRTTGFELDDIVGRSRGRFSHEELAAIERGERAIDPIELVMLLRAYQLDTDGVIPQRDGLILDLDRQLLEIGEHRVGFDSFFVDDVLNSYIGLLRNVRVIPDGTPLALRDDDLAELSLWLGPDVEDLRSRIDVLAEPVVLPWHQRTGVVVAATGIVVAVAVLIAFLGIETAPESIADELAPAGLVAVEPAPPIRIASGATATSPDVSVELSERAVAIEAELDWDFRSALPAWEVVYADAHPRWRGITNSVERTVTLFDRESTTVSDAAAVLAHELGHAIDLEFLDDTDRLAWLELRGIDVPWWADEGRADFSVGAGDFAEAVAAHLVGAPSRSDFGPFDDEQLAYVAEVVAALDNS